MKEELQGTEKSQQDLIDAQELIQFLECYYECEFGGKLTVSTEGDRHTMRFVAVNDYNPWYVNCEGRNYMDFFKEELKNHRFSQSNYFRAYRYDKN